MPKIALICVHYGPLPRWIPFTLETCGRNADIDWLLFGDCEPPPTRFPNIRFISLPVMRFKRLAETATGAKVHVSAENPRKICDLKPAYGKIFADYLEPYDFWGHVDVDIIWGRIRRFITHEVLAAHQVISSAHHMAGPFTLFENRSFVNRLFETDPSYREILENPGYMNFDEIGLHRQDYLSMDKIVRTLAHKKALSVLWGDFAAVDVHLKEWEVNAMTATGLSSIPVIRSGPAAWRDGRVFHLPSGQETMYHHFMIWKRTFLEIPSLDPRQLRSFEISDRGFVVGPPDP